jgi:glycosyltransferase involved in cell wall biosynthesis
MRITFVLPYAGLSGGNRVLAIYAERLRKRGHDVTVVSLPLLRLGLIRRIARYLRGRGWFPNPKPEPSYFDGLQVRHFVIDSHRPITDADVPDADIVLATFWMTGPWVMALSPRKGAKAILLQGHEISPGHENPEIDAVWRLPLRKIVISKWLVDLAREKFGDTNVHHVRNSVDTDQFNAPARGKQAVPTVGMQYATNRAKGIDVCFAALEKVRQHIPGLRVIAFGAHRDPFGVPLPDWVEFHYRPAQGEIPRLYAQCDVWLCGSRREGFHLPPLEAMACRCPVVSTKVGGPVDLIEQGVNGYLVEVDDSADLADKTLRILSMDETQWRRMSDAALATATGFSWDDATELLEQALLEISASASR